MASDDTKVVELYDWKKKLQRKSSGLALGHERNVFIAFTYAAELRDLLSYDEFRDRIVLTREAPESPDGCLGRPPGLEWGDQHLTWITGWLNSAFTVGRETVHHVAMAVAKSNSFHPVRAYLNGLTWDGTPRLQTFLKRYFGAKDHAAYLEAVGAKFLIGAVARIFDPGCQMDTVLVLEGMQGTGKSSAVQLLAGFNWARDITGDLTTKDAAINIQGTWIGEMAELASLKKGEQEPVKAFISRRIDKYRPPYGINSIDRPRHIVFIGTANEYEYLMDPTGARRIWPVDCTTVDLVGIERDRDQLWAEAVLRYRAHEPWHLNAQEARAANFEQQARQRLSPVETVLLEYLDGLRTSNVFTVDMRTLLAEVFEIDPRKDPAKAGGLAATIARTLTRSGWRRHKPTGRGANRRQVYEFKPENACEPYEPDEVGKHGRASDQVDSSQGSQGSQAESTEDIPF